MNTHTDNIHNIDDLILSFLMDEADEAQIMELNDWVRQSETNRDYFEKRKRIWISSTIISNTKYFDGQKAFERFLKNKKRINTNRNILKRCMPYAASVFLIIAGISIAYKLGQNKLIEAMSDISIETPLGAKTRLYLPDSTLVWVNAGSTLKYSQSFGITNRRIELEGEAYFEVTRNKSLPFCVKTKEMDINVLGTKFNIRNYSGDDNVIFSLNEGKVSLINNVRQDKNIDISPNHQAILNKMTGELSVSRYESERLCEWTKGILFFDEEPLSEIIKKLERQYDVKITLSESSLGKLCFYGKFEHSQYNISEILEIMSSTQKFKYHSNGREYTITPK